MYQILLKTYDKNIIEKPVNYPRNLTNIYKYLHLLNISKLIAIFFSKYHLPHTKVKDINFQHKTQLCIKPTGFLVYDEVKILKKKDRTDRYPMYVVSNALNAGSDVIENTANFFFLW